MSEIKETNSTSNYQTTKEILDWLAEVRPGFELKPNSIYPLFWIAQNNGQPALAVQMPSIKEWPDNILCPAITLYHLYTILWELFDCETPKSWQFQDCPKYYADLYWLSYTSGNPSMWNTSPNAVLEDIMKIYDELNK